MLSVLILGVSRLTWDGSGVLVFLQISFLGGVTGRLDLGLLDGLVELDLKRDLPDELV